MDKLDIIVVPLVNAFAVLPAVMVRQILPCAPLMPSEGKADYILGSLIVQNDKLDVVDLGQIFHGQPSENDDEKLIWFAPLQKQTSSFGFILRSVGLPQFMLCRADDFIERAKGEHPLIERYIDVRGLSNPNGYPVFIVDLFNLEKEIAR